MGPRRADLRERLLAGTWRSAWRSLGLPSSRPGSEGEEGGFRDPLRGPPPVT